MKKRKSRDSEAGADLIAKKIYTGVESIPPKVLDALKIIARFFKN